MIMVVKVHRRIAVRHRAGEDGADLDRAPRRKLQPPLLVTAEHVARAFGRPRDDPRRAGVGGEGFEAGVGSGEAGVVGADHRRLHEQCGGERDALRVGFPDLGILGVHEDVGAGLEVGEGRGARVEIEGAGAAAGHDRAAMAARLQRGARFGEQRHRGEGAGAALGAAVEVLEMAGIALDPGEAEVRRGRDRLGQRKRAVARGDAGAVLAHVEVDQDLQRPAGGGAGGGEVRHVRRAVGDDHQVRAGFVEGGQAAAAFCGDDRGGNEDRADAAGREDLRLAELGAADADRARLELAFGDLDRFVGLGVGAEGDVFLGAEAGHLRDVRFEQVEIEDERRGVEAPAAAGDVEEVGVEAGGCLDHHRLSLDRLNMRSPLLVPLPLWERVG